MTQFLYGITELMARIHNYILSWNDAYEYNFSDKSLHFLVIGILGMILVLVIHPIFLWLAKRERVLAITWIYVFTIIVVITFAIEIGQRATHTGTMDFGDIEFGLLGFICMFLIFALIRGIVKLVTSLRRKK